MNPIAVIGEASFYLLYAWLLSAIVSSWLSARKGYGEKIGLASGLFLVGVVVWLLWPPKPDSRWKVQGPLPFGKGRAKTVAEARAEQRFGDE